MYKYLSFLDVKVRYTEYSWIKDDLRGRCTNVGKRAEHTRRIQSCTRQDRRAQEEQGAQSRSLTDVESLTAALFHGVIHNLGTRDTTYQPERMLQDFVLR